MCALLGLALTPLLPLTAHAATPDPKATPTPSASPRSDPSPTPSPSPVQSPKPGASPSPSRSAEPVVSPVPERSPNPLVTPLLAASPTPTPTPVPSPAQNSCASPVTNLVQNNSFETVAGPGPPWFADPAEPAHAPHWTKTDATWPAPVVANDTFLGVALPGLNVTNLAEVGSVGPSAAPQGLVGDLFTATTPGSTYLVYAYVARGTVQGSALTFQARLRNHAGGAESAVIAHKTMPLPSAPNWELMSGALALSGSYDRVVLRLFTDTDNGYVDDVHVCLAAIVVPPRPWWSGTVQLVAGIAGLLLVGLIGLGGFLWRRSHRSTGSIHTAG